LSRSGCGYVYLGCRSSLVFIHGVITEMTDNDLGLNLYIAPNICYMVIIPEGVTC